MQDATKQVDDLLVLLEKLAPVLLMLRAIEPGVSLYFSIKNKINILSDFFKQDLSDTKEMQKEVEKRLYDLEQYSKKLNIFVDDVREIGDDSMQKASDMVTDGLPLTPEPVRLNRLKDDQTTFVNATMLFGVFSGIVLMLWFVVANELEKRVSRSLINLPVVFFIKTPC